ncbi:hypothetical protein DAD186_13580 [Dermabacter vaginalis]|uniref:Uncharacterized protein n=1 Tax=Dermabacter vaginalis TaxID=1630135 RepID=A0A1B0ZIX7_9MICO|nr:hypothetical protein DAD186_13580 [Dermabacter vaginalis]
MLGHANVAPPSLKAGEPPPRKATILPSAVGDRIRVILMAAEHS